MSWHLSMKPTPRRQTLNMATTYTGAEHLKNSPNNNFLHINPCIFNTMRNGRVFSLKNNYALEFITLHQVFHQENPRFRLSGFALLFMGNLFNNNGTVFLFLSLFYTLRRQTANVRR
jgi:hypothetical protein